MKTRIGNWHWLNWSLFTFRILWFAIGFVDLLTYPKFMNAEYLPLVLFVWLLLSYAGPLIFWRPGLTSPVYYCAAELLLSGSLNVYILLIFENHSSLILFPALMAGYVSTRRMMLWTAPAFIIFFPLLKPVLIHFELTELIANLVIGLLMYCIGYLFNRLLYFIEQNKQQFRLIQEKNSALEQYAKKIEQLTLVEERNRMARELHDTIGHTFTSVIVGMDAVSYLLEYAPEEAKKKLDILREVTRSGLEEVRRSIHTMAPPDFEHALSVQLRRLAEEFAQHTGTKASFNVKGIEKEVSQQVKLILIRCLQESLTNAKRHGLTTSVLILLQYEPSQLSMHVSDDGIGMKEVTYGFGLRSMTERLASVQGKIEVFSEPGKGTIVSFTLPLASAID